MNNQINKALTLDLMAESFDMSIEEFDIFMCKFDNLKYTNKTKYLEIVKIIESVELQN